MHSPVAQPTDARGPGRGPLYPLTFYLGEDATLELTGQTPCPDGLYELKVVWASTTGGYRGPVVVRVGRLDGAGRGHVRLPYDPDASRGPAVLFIVGDAPADWPALTYVTGSGCYAYQLDGRTFTEVIVFRVVARHLGATSPQAGTLTSVVRSRSHRDPIAALSEVGWMIRLPGHV